MGKEKAKTKLIFKSHEKEEGKPSGKRCGVKG
jgi:hypothetical protein